MFKLYYVFNILLSTSTFTRHTQPDRFPFCRDSTTANARPATAPSCVRTQRPCAQCSSKQRRDPFGSRRVCHSMPRLLLRCRCRHGPWIKVSARLASHGGEGGEHAAFPLDWIGWRHNTERQPLWTPPERRPREAQRVRSAAKTQRRPSLRQSAAIKTSASARPRICYAACAATKAAAARQAPTSSHERSRHCINI